MAAVGRTLVVGVVLVELDREGPRPSGGLCRISHDLHARAVPQHRVAGVGDLGARELRMGVIDVETCAVGEDEIRQAQVLVRQLTRIGLPARHVVAPGIAQGMLLIEVPARTTTSVTDRDAVVGGDDRRGGGHGIDMGVTRHADAVFGLDTHDPVHAHRGSPAIRGTDRCWARYR